MWVVILPVFTMSSTQAFFELSSSMLSPKSVGLSPFFAPAAERENAEPPQVSSILYEYTMCTKRALNTRIIGFGEPSLKSCVNDFVTSMRASSLMGSDAAALDAVCKSRRGTVDPYQLPWQPNERYLAWLRQQGRLVESPQ